MRESLNEVSKFEMELEITAEQQRLFQEILQAQETLDVQKLSHLSGVSQAMVMGTMTFAQEQGWIELEEIDREELMPGPDAKKFQDEGFPEKRFLTVIKENNGLIAIREALEKIKPAGLKINEIIKWGTMRGWLQKEQGNLVLTTKGSEALENPADDEKALEIVLARQSVFVDELPPEIDQQYVKEFLKKRPEAVTLKERTLRRIKLLEKGKNVIPGLKVKNEERNILTTEDIISGKWKEITLRPYDITLAAEPRNPVKCHPLQKIIQQTRRIFLEMGFNEIVSSHVETGFWDFDALFQPQDHPSRDLQDTFYMARPGKGNLPREEIVDRVGKTHENGNDTGSKGWGYKWDPEEARRIVLRTHTTASTVHALASDPHPPRKVFCVGRVFRNETISYKHLPEFNQVDGIIIDRHASFGCLLGTLQEFYKKMGFERVKFKPAFFPYTEPSAEVFVWMEQKKCWIELGGSGIFRPEVTEPMGCNVPVLAWGLGMERLAMLRYGISDIRTFYESDLDWLQEVKLCQ